MLFSIIIPTFNRVDLLISCLGKLNTEVQHFPIIDFEIIISDDAKDLKLKKLIEENFSNAAWIEGLQRGPAANRNNGAKYAKGDWVMFLDDDVIPDSNLLNTYAKAITENINILAFEGAIHPDDWSLLDFDLAECPVNTNGGSFWSANICIKRDLFNKINGFDEQFRIAAQEDQDIYKRIKKITQVHFVSNALVIHPVRIIKLRDKIRKLHIGVINWFKYSIKYESVIISIFKGYNSQFKSFLNNIRNFKFKSALCNLYVILIFLPTICLNHNFFYASRKN